MTTVASTAAGALQHTALLGLFSTAVHANAEIKKARILAAASDRNSAAIQEQTAEMKRATDYKIWSTVTETAVQKLRYTLLPHETQDPGHTIWVVLAKPNGETELPQLDELNGCLMQRTGNDRRMCYESFSDAFEAAGMAAIQANQMSWHTFYVYAYTTSIHYGPEGLTLRPGQLVIPFEIGESFNIVVDPRIRLEYWDTSFHRSPSNTMVAIENNLTSKITGSSKSVLNPEAMLLRVAPELIEEDRPWSWKKTVGVTAVTIVLLPIGVVGVAVDAYRGGPGELNRRRAEAATVAATRTTELRQRRTNEIRARDFQRELQAWRARMVS